MSSGICEISKGRHVGYQLSKGVPTSAVCVFFSINTDWKVLPLLVDLISAVDQLDKRWKDIFWEDFDAVYMIEMIATVK